MHSKSKFPRYLTRNQIRFLQLEFRSVFQLAKKAKVHEYYLGLAMRQERRLALRTFEKLAKASGITLEKFLKVSRNVWT